MGEEASSGEIFVDRGCYRRVKEPEMGLIFAAKTHAENGKSIFFGAVNRKREGVGPTPSCWQLEGGRSG